MRLVYEAVPPAAPVVTLALAALFALCALIVAIGMVKLVDAISRAFFGTVSGAVGWIPGAGGLAKRTIHKIEQKISHMLGTAERKLDAGVAMTWNNCAHLVAWIGTELEDAAKASWHLAQQAKAFVRQREMNHTIRKSTAPLKARQSTLRRDQHNLASEQRALDQALRSHVIPQGKTAAWEIEHVLMPGLEGVRDRERALELDFGRLWKWARHRKVSLTTGAFLGAFAWALGKFGIGWVRCSNVKKVGRALCRAPSPLIDAMIAALLAELVLANFRELVEFAQASQEEVTHEVARLLGLDLPRGRFTIE